MDSYDIIIAGAGHGGAQTAIALRQMGFEGSIAMIGDEPYNPYERPPLSKEYLSGEKTFERMAMRPDIFWEEREINILCGTRVSRVDSMGNIITLSNDRQLAYKKLVWATGGAPRMLDCPGSHAHNVFTLRQKRDADAIRSALPSAENINIIGGGYIGLEVAAAAAKIGKSVNLIELQDRLLSRVSGRHIADYFQKLHEAHGVTFRLNTKAEKFVTDAEGSATSIILEDGTGLPTDMVVFGIGIIPETGPLLAEGAMGGNGVDVDSMCRTNLPDIYAIGDCATHANPYANGAHVRLESVQNAHDQAKTVASHICGQDIPYNVVPWFWSNQYDAKLQTIGFSLGFDEEICRGDPESNSFSVIYRLDGKVIAVDCINRTKDYVQGKKLIENADILDAEQLANPGIPFKEVGLA